MEEYEPYKGPGKCCILSQLGLGQSLSQLCLEVEIANPKRVQAAELLSEMLDP